MTQESNTIINYNPVLLELFSGTGSVGRSFRARGWEVFSVDIDATAEPALVLDVLLLDHSNLPDRVDCIWASPPCTHYSRARTKAKTPRDLDGSDAIVQKVLDIVKWYDVPWFMENPESGLLKTVMLLQGFRFELITIASMVSLTAKGQRFGRSRVGNQGSPGANTTAP